MPENWIQSSSIEMSSLIYIILLIFCFPLATILFRYYLNTSWKNAFGIMMGNALVNVLMIFQYIQYRPFNDRVLFYLVLQTLLMIFITTLILKIFFRWGTDHLTKEERTPGVIGFQAWLSWPNLALGAAIASTVAIMSIHRSDPVVVFLISFFICICVLLLYPLINNMRRPRVPMNQPEDINQARLKILDLLESEKISAEECTELLKAMKQSQPTKE